MSLSAAEQDSRDLCDCEPEEVGRLAALTYLLHAPSWESAESRVWIRDCCYDTYCEARRARGLAIPNSLQDGFAAGWSRAEIEANNPME